MSNVDTFSNAYALSCSYTTCLGRQLVIFVSEDRERDSLYSVVFYEVMKYPLVVVAPCKLPPVLSQRPLQFQSKNNQNLHVDTFYRELAFTKYNFYCW